MPARGTYAHEPRPVRLDDVARNALPISVWSKHIGQTERQRGDDDQHRLARDRRAEKIAVEKDVSRGAHAFGAEEQQPRPTSAKCSATAMINREQNRRIGDGRKPTIWSSKGATGTTISSASSRRTGRGGDGGDEPDGQRDGDRQSEIVERGARQGFRSRPGAPEQP